SGQFADLVRAPMIRRAWMRIAVATLAGALLVSGLAADVRASAQWGPFRGQFVDVESGQPIMGGVVVVVWRQEQITLVASSTRFYAAAAAVSGADGRFGVPVP